MIRIAVMTTAIDVAATLAEVEGNGAGAVASFTGIVRPDDGVTALTLEHYPGMTEQVLAAIAEEAAARFGLTAVSVTHRVGTMVPGDRIVLVACAAAHRRDALAACTMLIDRLKTDAPFWKREQRGERADWVTARVADAEAADRWRTA
nr:MULTISPECIES: molybdenum cofactor biosynthesis protein MoaE [unclassified Sphingomonas]